MLLNNFKGYFKGFIKSEKGSIGLQEIMWICIGVVVIAVIFYPAIRTFGGAVVTALNTWWASISPNVFPTS